MKVWVLTDEEKTDAEESLSAVCVAETAEAALRYQAEVEIGPETAGQIVWRQRNPENPEFREGFEQDGTLRYVLCTFEVLPADWMRGDRWLKP